MKHEGIGITAKLGDDEGHSLGHQAGHKGHVARQAVELGNNYAALRSLCRGQRCGQLRAPIQGVRALPAFGFDKLGGNSEAFASGKMIDGGSLGVNRRSNLTPYRRPILTPLSGGFWW
jgi:hypothetical protein